MLSVVSSWSLLSDNSELINSAVCKARFAVLESITCGSGPRFNSRAAIIGASPLPRLFNGRRKSLLASLFQLDLAWRVTISCLIVVGHTTRELFTCQAV